MATGNSRGMSKMQRFTFYADGEVKQGTRNLMSAYDMPEFFMTSSCMMLWADEV